MNFNGKVNLYIQRITASRAFWISVSMLSAVVLWFYVTSTEGVEIEKTISDVKVEFLGADTLRESSGLIVTDADCQTVDVTISGTRRVVGGLNSSNVKAVVNLSRIVSDGRYSILYDMEYPIGTNTDAIKVVRSSTDLVNFYVDKLASKTVELMGVFSGSAAEGYMAEENMVFDPQAVKISGPKTVINTVDHAVVTITREGIDKTVQFDSTYTLVNADGDEVDSTAITRELEEVNVTLSVLSTKAVPLDVTIVDGGGATREENTSIDIEPKTIMLAGDAETIDNTTKLILGTIDLSSFATDYTTTFTIVPPNDTENLTGIKEATVTVSVKGVSTRQMAINSNNMSCINVPEGYDAEIITQSLTVTVRAPEETLFEIREQNLRAVADLSLIESASTGVFTPTVKVYIDGFPEAGIVGEYKIYVTLNG